MLKNILDTNINALWESSGNYPWKNWFQNCYYGNDCAAIELLDNENAWVKTTVTGSGYLEFYWKANSTQSMKFYIDDELKEIDEKEPYSWKWNETAIGSHIIKAIAYDMVGNYNVAQSNVWILSI